VPNPADAGCHRPGPGHWARPGGRGARGNVNFPTAEDRDRAGSRRGVGPADRGGPRVLDGGERIPRAQPPVPPGRAPANFAWWNLDHVRRRKAAGGASRRGAGGGDPPDTACGQAGRWPLLPMEGRGMPGPSLGTERDPQVVMHGLTGRVPNQVGSAVAQSRGVDEQRIRVIAPGGTWAGRVFGAEVAWTAREDGSAWPGFEMPRRAGSAVVVGGGTAGRNWTRRYRPRARLTGVRAAVRGRTAGNPRPGQRRFRLRRGAAVLSLPVHLRGGRVADGRDPSGPAI